MAAIAIVIVSHSKQLAYRIANARNPADCQQSLRITRPPRSPVCWQAVVDEVVTSYHTLEDSYLQERVDDVVDVGQRVLRLLAGNAPANLHFKVYLE